MIRGKIFRALVKKFGPKANFFNRRIVEILEHKLNFEIPQKLVFKNFEHT